MNTQVSFCQMDTSNPLRDYATGKLERIVDKYVTGVVNASVVMKVQKYWHIADFTLNIKNLTIKGQERSEDMYSSIDLALDKIETQLRRHKDRLRDHQPSHGSSKMFKMGVISALESREEFNNDYQFDDFLNYPSAESGEPILEVAPEAAESGVRILRQKSLLAKALTLEEAIIQLDLLVDREFFVFSDAETEAIHVVYKRRDGNIGLIET